MSSLRVQALVMTGCVLAAACTGPTTRRVQLPNSTVTIPARVLQLAEARWDGAVLAPVAPSATTQPCAAADSPSAVTGDFNGDGAQDVIVRVMAKDGPHLAVGFARLNDYQLQEVSRGPAVVAGAMSVRTKGLTYYMGDSAVDFYFGTDTLLVTPCSGDPTAYFWTGDGFEPEVIKTVQPPVP